MFTSRSRMIVRPALGMLFLASAAAVGPRAAGAATRYIGTDSGETAAAVVAGRSLVHTAQMQAPDASAALKAVDEAITAAGGDELRVVKLNVVARSQEGVEQAREAIARHFPAAVRPPVSYVVGELAGADATVAVDAVAVHHGAAGTDVAVTPGEPGGPFFGARAAVLPAGPRLYVSGQAEKAASPAEAAAKTIASLIKTLEFCGATPGDVVQAKCFLTPMSAAAEVSAEFDKAVSPGTVPLVFVEWKSTLPIEIELVARAPKAAPDAPAVEYLTPPGMTASPIFARVTRVNAPETIYVAGLYSSEPGSGEAQTTAIFDRLGAILKEANSDVRHLAKATYYVSDDDASKKLNEVRPRYYDPQRPPAASKAMVPAVGRPERSIAIDMIAVPGD